MIHKHKFYLVPPVKVKHVNEKSCKYVQNLYVLVTPTTHYKVSLHTWSIMHSNILHSLNYQISFPYFNLLLNMPSILFGSERYSETSSISFKEQKYKN